MTEELARREQTLKGLWKRPEGVFGIITGTGLIGGLLVVLYKALPFLITLATNLIWLIVEVVVLFLLLYVLLNKDTWRNLSLIWYQLNRKVLSWVVDMDPISILKKAINEMHDNLDIVHEKNTELGSVIVSMEEKLKEFKKDFDSNTRKKKMLEEQIKSENAKSNPDTKVLFAKKNALTNVNNELVRGQEQIKRQIERLKTSTKYHEIMEKLEVYATYKVQDAESELRFKEEEFKQAKAARSAMKSIMGIIKGGLSDTMEQEMALASINETVNMSVAEMRRLIDGSNDILTNFELNSDINADKAEELLKQYEQNGFEIFNTEHESPEVNANMMRALQSGQKVPVMIEDVEYVEAPKNTKYF